MPTTYGPFESFSQIVWNKTTIGETRGSGLKFGKCVNKYSISYHGRLIGSSSLKPLGSYLNMDWDNLKIEFKPVHCVHTHYALIVKLVLTIESRNKIRGTYGSHYQISIRRSSLPSAQNVLSTYISRTWERIYVVAKDSVSKQIYFQHLRILLIIQDYSQYRAAQFLVKTN